jgi:hypothetical protein
LSLPKSLETNYKHHVAEVETADRACRKLQSLAGPVLERNRDVNGRSSAGLQHCSLLPQRKSPAVQARKNLIL